MREEQQSIFRHKTGYIKVFKDKKKLAKMLAYYKEGYGMSELGRKYGVDHTSILYQIQKHNVVRIGKPKTFDEQGQKRIPLVPPPPPKQSKYEKTINAPINKGHDYEHYLELTQKRYVRKFERALQDAQAPLY